jgi:hypothetical protein
MRIKPVHLLADDRTQEIARQIDECLLPGAARWFMLGATREGYEEAAKVLHHLVTEPERLAKLIAEAAAILRAGTTKPATSTCSSGTGRTTIRRS